jgi:hypothetical protein
MGLSLRGQTSGAIDINAPNVAGDNTITLPGTNGAANQFYKNSGTAGIVTHSSMIEDSSGNIGINRTDPDQKLNINGNLEVNAYDNPSGSGGYYTPKGLIIGNAYDAGKTTTDDRNAIIWQERGLDLDIATSDTLRMKITYDGKIGIGTDVPSELLHLQSGWTKQILKSTNLNTASSLIFDTHNINTADFLLGQLAGRWNGNDVAYINFEAGADTTNKDDGVISFLTSPSGSTPTERLRILSSGGITFNGDTATANALDDYEEGNWTPSTTNFTHTVNANDCYYTKIGRRVTVYGQIARDQVAAPSSAYFEITGMPFARGTNLRSIEGSFWLDNGNTATDYIGGISYFYTTTNLIFGIGSNPAQQASTRYVDATHFNNTRGILFYVSYSVD